MKKISLILCTILSCIALNAQTYNASKKCFPLRDITKSASAFKAGEKLVFAVHYSWGPINSDVAKATLSCDSTAINGRPCYHVRMYGKTPKFYDMFFRLREDFQGWFTMDTQKPLRFTRDTHEGNYDCTNKFVYNWNTKKINADLYSSSKGHRSIQIPLTDCVYDVPTLLYVCRNMDFSKVHTGSKVPLTFAIDDDVYTIYLTRIRDEQKRVKGLGLVNTIKFSASVVAGEVFESQDDKIYMWFTNDDNRIPVCFEFVMKLGAISGRLDSYKGLNHPFKSLVSN